MILQSNVQPSAYDWLLLGEAFKEQSGGLAFASPALRMLMLCYLQPFFGCLHGLLRSVRRFYLLSYNEYFVLVQLVFKILTYIYST